ncbi:hypothetical protein WJ33_22555 [Burkholderia ubonensis]|uniref:Uncharacterized protein n=1 Tax=Burkholderia ubonensis TaxID=101571 RepID=A0A103RKF0_9BURK|nr:hypothetical protein [Burkholderia ubonensis]KVG69422.1 hypothetical protein WJ33_22555 [Burkholderia ubonensis]
MTKQHGPSHGRRSALFALAAITGSALSGAFATTKLAPARMAHRVASQRSMTQLIGANGGPGTHDDVMMWQKMGLSWARDSVGPGQRYSANSRIDVDKTGPAYDADLPAALLREKRGGIKTLLMLGYTPIWNASLPGDSKSAPKDVAAWERYVEAAVRKYSAPPYNITHFQVWNEAGGRMSGGQSQSSFWHGPGFNANPRLAKSYDFALQDYVERIHIPAARIIRKHGALVVYGGWPDQGGIETFVEWLEYRSALFNARMIDWVDYLDTHYLGIDALTILHDRYVADGKVMGIWQTEIGDRYMIDPHYLPTYYFRFAVWALEHNWNHPDKYVSMVYHWEGHEPFHLTHRGNPRGYNVSGLSLVVLHRTASGALRSFEGSTEFGPKVTGLVLSAGENVVLQIKSEPGWRSINLRGLPQLSKNRFEVSFIDALTGRPEPPDAVTTNLSANRLSISFRVPDLPNGNSSGEMPLKHLAYLVVRPVMA